jgi:Domain of unknown function (DUF3859)
MTRTLISLIALFISIGFAAANSGPTINVYEYGTYASPPSVTVGFTRRGMDYGAIEYIELVQSTRTVVGAVGNQFGFRYRVEGLPLGTRVPLTMIIKFPPPGVAAKSASTLFLDDDYSHFVAAGSERFWTWTFDDQAQIVPGVWTLEIWYGKQKLAEQTFIVVLPPIAKGHSET